MVTTDTQYSEILSSISSSYTGTLYIMVMDTDSTPGNMVFDTLYVDYMAIV